MGFIIDKLTPYFPQITSLQADLLGKYLDILLDYNTRFNLTAITSYDEAVVKHLADSLAGAPFIPEGASVIDIGSGGGCPALPLKIVRPDIRLTMTDSVGKKVDFLNIAVSELQLTNASAIKVRAEELARTDKRESYDTVTARAVAGLPILLELASPLLKVKGKFIAYKGNNKEELDTAHNAAIALNCRLTDKHDYILEGEHERTLLIYQKTATLPGIYPRPYAKIQKQPL